MRQKTLFGMGLLAVLIFSVGCASYSPSLVRLDTHGPTAGRQAGGDLTVYVEEFATLEKSEKGFDTDLVKEGVLPLLVLVENNGQHPYTVKTMDIVVLDQNTNTALRPLTPEETAKRAKRNAITRALGWSMIVPIITIPVAVTASAIHTSKVNKQITLDFSAKAFSDASVMPNKNHSGFVFFELPKGRKDLSGLALQLTSGNEATGESLTLVSSLPSATFKPVKVTPDLSVRKENREEGNR